LNDVRGLFLAARRRPTWLRYGGGAALILGVVAGRLALDPWWGRQQNRHLVFLPAVMLTAWLFGFGPGLVSVVVSLVALASFWSGGGTGRVQFELVMFLVMSVAICALVRSLQRARERADAARTSREQVLAVVAHDLRAPLATIMVSSTSLGRDPSNPEVVRHRLRAIDRAVVRMDNLIRDIVDAAGVERGELPMTMKQERVDPIIREAMELHAPLAQEAGVTLEAKIGDKIGGKVGGKIGDKVGGNGEGKIEATPERPDLLIACDRQRILQVLGNLVGNALKFTPAGGHITVRAEEHEEVVSFVVEDTGSGIAPDHLPHLFERYWSADSRGIGLGLYIARSIVLGHGGDIGVRSTPGSGSSFFFSVPRSLSPPPEPARGDQPSRPARPPRALTQPS
jgi:signal transduction histidine kinase